MSLLGCLTGISNTDKSTTEVLVVSLPKFLPAAFPISVNERHSLQWVDEELWSHPHLLFGWQPQPPHGAPCTPSPPHSLLSTRWISLALKPFRGSPGQVLLWPASPGNSSDSSLTSPAFPLHSGHTSLPLFPDPGFLSPCGCICCSLHLESSSCGSPHGPHLTSVSLK